MLLQKVDIHIGTGEIEAFNDCNDIHTIVFILIG